MKIVYTKHAQEKFLYEKYVFQLSITKELIRNVLCDPIYEDDTRGDKITVIGTIDAQHVLIVVYRLTQKKEKLIITFFPARRARYEAYLLR